MRRLFTLLPTLPAALAISAGINSPTPGGDLLRGELMLEARSPQAALDRLTDINPGQYTASQAEAAEFATAQATLLDGRPAEARRLFELFALRYPASPLAVTARMGVADCLFYEGEYRAALDVYGDIDPSTLDLAAADDYRYRSAFSEMMLGRYSEALDGFSSLRRSARYADAAAFYMGYIYYAQGNYAEARPLLEEANSSVAPGDHAPFYLTQIAYAEGDYDRALEMARDNMDRIEAYRPELERIAGESLYYLGDEDRAMNYLDSYVTASSDPQKSALYLLGVTLYKHGEWQQAIENLSKVAGENDAMGQSAYLYIGQAYLKLGNVNSALLALEKAYRMDYDRNVRETAFYNYAVARSQGGRTPFGSSVTIFETFLRDFPDSRYAPEVQEYLVTGYMTDNNYEQALASIERIKRPSASILAAKQRVLYILGSRDLAAGQVSRALTRFTEAKGIKGGDRTIAAECDLWIADCLYRKGEYARAASSALAYLRAVPSGPNRSLAYYDLAYCRFAEKRYADARTDFERVLSQPGNLSAEMLADAQTRIADCLYYSSDFAGAGRAYDRALEMNPSAGDYALYQKAMMAGFARDYSGKISQLDDMMKRFPTSALVPAALLQQAESHLALSRPAEAIKIYRHLVANYSGTSQGRNGHLQLAVTLLGQGERPRAIATYKEVISRYPTSEEARLASDDLKRLLAEDGRLQEYASFIASVPDAPKFEVSELDALTFEAAEKAYLTDPGATGRLKEYISTYPGGKYEPQALAYLATASVNAGNTAEAYEYAKKIIERYPDSEATEDALAIRGSVELDRGDAPSALSTFTLLEQRASAGRNLNLARLGIMRAALDLGRNEDALGAADRLLASTGLQPAQRNEVILVRAQALAATGRTADAVKAWEQIASETDDPSGAQAAFRLAEYRFGAGQPKQARAAVEKLIDSNTPHSYWLARGYILLSDIYRSQGNTFEADEYLKSLKENYPGSEPDIFNMIDQRLNTSK